MGAYLLRGISHGKNPDIVEKYWLWWCEKIHAHLYFLFHLLTNMGWIIDKQKHETGKGHKNKNYSCLLFDKDSVFNVRASNSEKWQVPKPFHYCFDHNKALFTSIYQLESLHHTVSPVSGLSLAGPIFPSWEIFTAPSFHGGLAPKLILSSYFQWEAGRASDRIHKKATRQTVRSG